MFKRLSGFPLEGYIALVALVGITLNLLLRYAFDLSESAYNAPLYITLAVGGGPLLYDLLRKILKAEFGSDLLAGIAIVTAALLDEYFAGAIVVLMLSGGETLENYAVGRASTALTALAKRMPTIAHRRNSESLVDVALDDVHVGDILVVLPHEVCPVDGTVIDGRSVMDESYLTGEPFEISKTPGAEVISGAMNGESPLTIRATRIAEDSRYAKVIQVMRESQQRRPRLRRLGDQLGAWYTPLAVSVALAAWWGSGDPIRFLATLVIATPCPLLIAIPTAIIGAVSAAARRSIIIRDPSALENIDTCRTIILDKTGTLTFGKPELTDEMYAPGVDRSRALSYAASIERYSKHPLAEALISAAERAGLEGSEVTEVSEKPGSGMRGKVDGHNVEITGRTILSKQGRLEKLDLPPSGLGLECIILIDGGYVATYRFHDRPRADSRPFVEHLGPMHLFDRVMIVSGDRESEVRYLAEQVGVSEIHAGQSPEEKVSIVRRETELARTLFIGDGINDAPAMINATVGVAFGKASDVTAEAAEVVIMESSLERVDELFHIGRRLRRIALQSALGGMALSIVGMGFAAFGYLPPVAGAIGQEIIDLAAVLNALRMAFVTNRQKDY
ncbi:MAG: heavy metal translocating P-type ATPase [Candidatus Zixiibacteriota bacterium]